MAKLNTDCFAPQHDRNGSIYNRFFRTAIKGAKYFFPETKYNKIIIDNIYHDKGNQEHYQYFAEHVPKYLNINDKQISVTNPQVEFVHSDHRKVDPSKAKMIEASHFIQFIDLIMGSFICCLTDSSSGPKKMKLATLTLPLLRNMLEKPLDSRNSYNYYRKQQISFFPTDEIDHRTPMIQTGLLDRGEEIKSSSNKFYHNRRIEMRDPSQRTLF